MSRTPVLREELKNASKRPPEWVFALMAVDPDQPTRMVVCAVSLAKTKTEAESDFYELMHTPGMLGLLVELPYQFYKMVLHGVVTFTSGERR